MTQPKDNPRPPADRGQGRRKLAEDTRRSVPCQVRLTRAEADRFEAYGAAVVAPVLGGAAVTMAQAIRTAALDGLRRWESEQPPPAEKPARGSGRR